jgi:protein MPE1
MMSAQSANWDSQQEKMAHANPVYHRKKLPLSVPDKPPPQGYICHRCGEKGHWIQACPTNDDPNFDNKPRIKRTTGIPKTFLKRAEKPSFDDDGGGDAKTNGIMLNADGEYVVVEPDSRSWATYQAKQSAAGDGDVYSHPLPPEHKDWECQICGKVARDAVRTPCCKTVFCDRDIQSALLEADFVCPACGTNDVLLDSLVADEEVRAGVAEYVKKWEAERAKEMSSPPSHLEEEGKKETLSPPPFSRKRSWSPAPSEETTNKKVAMEESSKSPNVPKSSPAMSPAVAVQQPFNQFQHQQQFNNMPPFMLGMPPIPFPPFPPPDPFMMAAMGIPPPPMPGMMPPMPVMGPGLYPQQGFNPGHNQGYNQGYNQMGNQLYGGENAAYMRRPMNERGMRRAQRGGSGASRSQADYRELI